MREAILDYLRGLKLKTFAVSNELPFSNSGVEMYLKNPKKIYVDESQIVKEDFIPTFGAAPQSNTTTNRVYFSSDAKLQPVDYSSLITLIKDAKDIPAAQDYFRRAVNVTTSYQNDLMLTEIEFTFTKLS